ncbi:MAG TPA: cytochrome c biogenesis protein CcsA [Verrucomicrobiae bacterium]|jgi:ABC-type transport system involved in cytochrome c biogenesis permease subunit|nr:cytochrome c biogenesis protein CcsA [Verrucomicrobiae bacterium]
MHDLDKLILEWRKTAAMPNVSAETLDELETHLRETTAQFVRSGMPVSNAFQRAVTELGEMPRISSEFRKLDQPIWLPVKLAIGATAPTALAALVIAIAVLGRRGSSAASLLLATHVFVIILGYTITLLVGGLGICFVSQRSFDDFLTSRLQSISRVSFVLGGVALLCTTIGVILGMAWSKITWGRYWSWDAKETGGLCVIVWLFFYLLAHRFFKSSARGILTVSMLGNIVVSLAWFGPQLNGLQQYRIFSQSMLLMAAVANLVFFAIGYCPAGWLRSKQA